MFDFDVRSGHDAAGSETAADFCGKPTFREEFTQPISRVPRRSALVVEPSCSLVHACRLMADRQVGTALVASVGVLLGMVTEADMIRRLLDSGAQGGNLPLWRVMAPEPQTLLETDSVAYAIRKFGTLGVRSMPTIRPEGPPFGLLEAHDLVTWISGRMGAEAYGRLRNG
jgi:CBS domain-containing protein